MGTIKLNKKENIEEQTALTAIGTEITNTDGLFKFETVEEQEDGSYSYEDMLEVRGSASSAEWFFAKIQIKTALIPSDSNTKSVKLQLTAKDNPYGCFVINNTCYDAIAGKTYTIDITEKIKNINSAVIEVLPFEGNNRVEFYTSGEYAPKIILLSAGDPEIEDTAPTKDHDLNLKELAISDKITSYINLNDGEITTEVKAFDEGNLSLPLDIVFYNRRGCGNGSYGKNWRLNLDKKLVVSGEDTEKTTLYSYRDEMGYKHNFVEKYYYYENGGKVFIAKDNVKIDLNGDLTYENKPVYRHQSCNGYTLIPEINDFKGADLIEQRQNEQIQLEQTVQAYENSLIDYVIVSGGTITSRHLESLSKQDCEEFFRVADQCISEHDFYVVMHKADALQLEALNLSPNTLNNSKQFAYMFEKAKKNLQQVKEAFKTYFKKKAELEQLWRSVPVRFLRDKYGIVSGFNKYGDLVYVCNAYGNYVIIERNPDNKIVCIYDGDGKTVDFEYSDGLLQSITDGRGGTVKFAYDGEKLKTIKLTDESGIIFETDSTDLKSISTDDDFKYSYSYINGKVVGLTTASKSLTIDKQISYESNNFDKTLSQITICYNANSTTLTDNCNNKETYSFNSDGLLTSYKEEKNTGVITVTTYQTTDTKWHISTTTTNVDDKVMKITEKYNDIDLLISKETDWQQISSTVKVKMREEYEYDNNEKIIKKKTVKTEKVGGVNKNSTSVVKYNYNANGSLILTESYVEGEELTSGINFEERVYDDNGNVLKIITWNSLDSSTKFHSEKTYSENGQVVADKDGLGEVAAEYEYVNGTGLINTVKSANGGKTSYGRNPYNDVITSVTQSTEDGEENKTDIVYNHGLPVEVKSGNTVIDYAYNSARQKIGVAVNGNIQARYSYQDYNYNEETDSCIFSRIKYTEDFKKTLFESTKSGTRDASSGIMQTTDLLQIDGIDVLKKNYDVKGRLVEEYNYVLGDGLAVEDNWDGYEPDPEVNASENEGDGRLGYYTAYTYDDYGNVISIGSNLNLLDMGRQYSVQEKYKYDEYGLLISRSIATACGQKYIYTYKDNAARDLDYISFGDYKFKPLTDVNGRNTGKEIYNGEDKIAAEYVSYRKVGDHATNMPACVWFGSGKAIKDSIKYKYDNCGNICEIIENGHIVAKYKYDSINRLIREDNKVLNKTVLYTYDNCGNITERCEYAYTTKDGEELSELECTHHSYEYDGDKLLSYDGEACEYNSLGNPTKYRDKTVGWLYGKFLTEYDGNKYIYDSRGRRINKNGVQHIYDDAGNLICTFGQLQFIHDHAGVTGIIYDNKTYFYRKDAQGNIIAILDNTGAVVVKYVYDAWGNHAVLDADGNDIEDADHIGNLNPFRYRGYYYDVETGLYFLQTRYYDPETGRFISQDSLDYADPTIVNGLNLYAYCGNNPVMGYDPSGHVFLSIFFGALLLGAVFGAASGAAQAAINGESVWKGALIGFLKGVVIGGAFGLGAGIAATTTNIILGLVGLLITASGSFAAGMGIYTLETKLYDREFNKNDMLLAGLNLSLKAIANYGMGYLIGSKGMFKQTAKINKSSISMFFKSLKFKIKYAIPNVIERAYVKLGTVTVFSWLLDGIFRGFYSYEKD